MLRKVLLPILFGANLAYIGKDPAPIVCAKEKEDEYTQGVMSKWRELKCDQEGKGKDAFCYTALHEAMKKCNTNTMEALAREGSSLRYKDDMGYAPAHEAINSKCLPGIKFLLDRGEDDYFKRSDEALHVALSECDSQMVHTLLRVRNQSHRPDSEVILRKIDLERCSSEAFKEIVLNLVHDGINLDAHIDKDYHKEEASTLLYKCDRHKKCELARALLNAGANPFALHYKKKQYSGLGELTTFWAPTNVKLNCSATIRDAQSSWEEKERVKKVLKNNEPLDTQ